MKNKRGYTLIELLAVITIIGILSVVAVVAYSRYADSARKQSYDTLAKSAYHAAQNYVMGEGTDNPVTLETLVEEQFLENYNDPSGSKCTNSAVTINDDDTYKVKLCCSNYKYEYTFPGGESEKTTCD